MDSDIIQDKFNLSSISIADEKSQLKGKWLMPGTRFTEFLAISIDSHLNFSSTLEMNDSWGCVQLIVCLTQEPEVLGSIPGPATYFQFSFC